MILYRPVGTKELDLIRESGWTRYPPRLPDQPIFYPVLNEEYAVEIASRSPGTGTPSTTTTAGATSPGSRWRTSSSAAMRSIPWEPPATGSCGFPPKSRRSSRGISLERSKSSGNIPVTEQRRSKDEEVAGRGVRI